ncbi:MAG: thioredoxin-dependent thiol peroxidase [Desulfomonilaceae bacterium]|nr:thioredoxin-dependent thiol peroxidase [Desulfomonilaceae bacterium]
MATLKTGDHAPSLRLVDQDGKEVKLSDFKGKKLLLYFYPKADTSGCTKQACSIRDADPDFSDLGVAAVGISPDKPAKLKKFDEKHGLGFVLLSDPDNSTAKAYGAWGEKKMYGKTYEGIIRSSFLIDESGTVVEAWYNVKPLDTVPKAREALDRMKD